MTRIPSCCKKLHRTRQFIKEAFLEWGCQIQQTLACNAGNKKTEAARDLPPITLSVSPLIKDICRLNESGSSVPDISRSAI